MESTITIEEYTLFTKGPFEETRCNACQMDPIPYVLEFLDASKMLSYPATLSLRQTAHLRSAASARSYYSSPSLPPCRL